MSYVGHLIRSYFSAKFIHAIEHRVLYLNCAAVVQQTEGPVLEHADIKTPKFKRHPIVTVKSSLES